MAKKVVLELIGEHEEIPMYYIPSTGEHISSIKTHKTEFMDTSNEFGNMVTMILDFYREYSVCIASIDKDTIVFRSDIMMALKKNNTLTPKKFNELMSFVYKILKVADFKRPNEIYYYSDGGEIDEYCARNTWEPTLGDVHVLTNVTASNSAN